MGTSMIDTMSEDLNKSIKQQDLDSIKKTYRENNELVFIENFLPIDFVNQYLLSEADKLRPEVHRSYFPGYKKAGSISYNTLAEKAPNTMSVYRSQAFMDFIGHLVEKTVMLCPEADPHSCALYYYTEPGDHIGNHIDGSYYKGKRYTILIGLVQNSEQCKLLGYLDKFNRKKETRKLEIMTHPGSMVLFNGDKLWHGVSALGENEERIMLAIEYITDPRINRVLRFVSDMKDAIGYFGFSNVFRRRRPSS